MDILKSFGFDTRLLIAQMINFLVLLFLLYKLAYKRVLALLEERKKRIAESQEQAKQIEERLTKLDGEQQSILKNAQAQADSTLAQAKESAQAIAQQAAQETKAQTEKMLERAKQSAQAEYDQMQQKLKHDVVNIAVMAAEKATGNILSREQKEALTQKAATEIQASWKTKP